MLTGALSASTAYTMQSCTSFTGVNGTHMMYAASDACQHAHTTIPRTILPLVPDSIPVEITDCYSTT